MKILTVAIAGATVLTTVPAIAAADDPLQLIYRVSGVFDSGDVTNVGMATTFFCTNFGNVAEKVRIRLLTEDGGTPANNTFDFDPERHERTRPTMSSATTSRTPSTPERPTGKVRR